MHVFRGFPGGSDGKESACNAGDPDLILGSKMPWRRKWLPTPVILTCTEEPGRLQFMWSQRVRYNWVTNIFTFCFTIIRNKKWRKEIVNNAKVENTFKLIYYWDLLPVLKGHIVCSHDTAGTIKSIVFLWSG